MSWGGHMASCALAVALSLGVGPALADAAVNPGLPVSHARLASQDLIATGPLSDDGSPSDGATDNSSAETPSGADAPAIDTPSDLPDGEETAVGRACRLIDAIPYDPYKVTLADADAIHAAEEAYAALTEAEQQQLDTQEAASGVLTYGRALQCASWGLDALAPVDDVTSLVDGTYTTQVSSTCEMGKSNSVRGYKFTVTKVTVKNGHATATLEHATASPDTVSIGGIVYSHSNADEKAHSTFEVPVDLNSTFHLSQMAKNPTASTIAIPYEMTVAIDEENATPDPLPVENGGEGDSEDGSNAAGTADADGKQPDSSKTPATKPSSPAKTPAATAKPSSPAKASVDRSDPQRQASPAGAASTIVAPAVPAVSGASGAKGSKKASDSKADAGAATQSAPDAPAEGSALADGAGAAAATGIVQVSDLADAQPAVPDYFQITAVCAIALLAVGLVAFPLDYLRRDRKPVQVSGVRLSDARE